MKFIEITLHWRCTSVGFSIQHPRTLGRPSRAGVRVGWIIQPTRTSARDGRPRVPGQLVCRSVDGIKFPCYSGAQIHSLGVRAF